MVWNKRISTAGSHFGSFRHNRRVSQKCVINSENSCPQFWGEMSAEGKQRPAPVTAFIPASARNSENFSLRPNRTAIFEEE